MSNPTLTLTLPSALYDELLRRAQGHHRRVEDEATLALSAALEGSIGQLDDLAGLDDESLWRVSESQPTTQDGVLLSALVDKRRRQGLTPGEEGFMAELIDRHDRGMALRAEAIALLHQRGIDVGDRVARA